MPSIAEQNIIVLEELSDTAMHEFCSGYQEMFERKFVNKRQSTVKMDAASLHAELDGIIAANYYDLDGAVDGSFSIILDKPALFIMGGATIMLPGDRIKESATNGTVEDAEFLADSVGEIGNLLTGAFAAIFRAGHDVTPGLDEHLQIHLRLPVPIGEKILELDETFTEYNVLTYELTLDTFNPFLFRVVFPTQP